MLYLSLIWVLIFFTTGDRAFLYLILWLLSLCDLCTMNCYLILLFVSLYDICIWTIVSEIKLSYPILSYLIYLILYIYIYKPNIHQPILWLLSLCDLCTMNCYLILLFVSLYDICIWTIVSEIKLSYPILSYLILSYLILSYIYIYINQNTHQPMAVWKGIAIDLPKPLTVHSGWQYIYSDWCHEKIIIKFADLAHRRLCCNIDNTKVIWMVTDWSKRRGIYPCKNHHSVCHSIFGKYKDKSWQIFYPPLLSWTWCLSVVHSGFNLCMGDVQSLQSMVGKENH